VNLIDGGEVKDKFIYNHALIRGTKLNSQQRVAACLLDKTLTIAHRMFNPEFNPYQAESFKKEVGSCCVGSPPERASMMKSCIQDITPAYDALVAAMSPLVDSKHMVNRRALAAKALGIIATAVRSRLGKAENQITDYRSTAVLMLCPEASTCTQEEVFNKHATNDDFRYGPVTPPSVNKPKPQMTTASKPPPDNYAALEQHKQLKGKQLDAVEQDLIGPKEKHNSIVSYVIGTCIGALACLVTLLDYYRRKHGWTLEISRTAEYSQLQVGEDHGDGDDDL